MGLLKMIIQYLYLGELLNNADEIHLKDGGIIYNYSYFNEHIKPTLTEEDKNQIVHTFNNGKELIDYLISRE